MPEQLTERQAEILDFLRITLWKTGRPPSFREIADEFGMASPNAVTSHLKALEAKGYIERDVRVARGIRVLGGPPTMHELRERVKELEREIRRLTTAQGRAPTNVASA